MNATVQSELQAAYTRIRAKMKEGLAQLPEGWQKRFKQMYAGDDLDKPIDAVVDDMPEEKLDWAMQQIENSLGKLAAE